MSELKKAWPAIRSVLKEFTFYNIKDIVAASGLDVQRLAHLQQRSGSMSTSKGMLLDEIEKILFQMDPEQQNRTITYCITEMLQSSSRCRDRLEELLFRFGWGISGTEPYPIALQINVEAESLPEPMQIGLQKALKRYRDGDMSGAISAICGVIDKITETVYTKNSAFGDHKEASYQERIAKSYNVFEHEFKATLKKGGFEDDETATVWQNQRQAINQAAYVMGSYRRNISDVHGDQKVDGKLVQQVLDNAVFIIRSFSAYL